MKFVVLLAIVGFIAATPVYLFEALVVPELNKLSNTYSTMGQTAEEIANAPAPK